MSTKTFIVQELYDVLSIRVEAASPREALSLALAKLNPNDWGSADMYAEAGANQDWDFDIWEPSAGPAAEHIHFVLA
jgi:hypothetical protein